MLSSSEIRKYFIDYFVKSHKHVFVRSSPVVPFCDPTLAFVNSGMNQFKSVFLGSTTSVHKRVTNSQKCIRVGGKHNDLNVVGQDGYHHTFFEMLGNWSFGDYFKREACEMALNLLCGVYGINQSRLYFTYFGGDKNLNIPPDQECYEIWRDLKIPKDHILPFSSKDNFWEMGKIGPCGPCTEIHIDRRLNVSNRNASKLVNSGCPDVTELWNLVFMQYNRKDDGSLDLLPVHHVDTGMGFERLTAVLQQKNSNYDTDIFLPILEAIHRHCKISKYESQFSDNSEKKILDEYYRIIADHSRMVIVCLADGMFPDKNPKLRRVLRKVFRISETVFSNINLLSCLIPYIAETLETVYPEISLKRNSIQSLIDYELQVYKRLQEKTSKEFTEILHKYPNFEVSNLMECAGLAPAYKLFLSQKPFFKDGIIPGHFLYKLTDTHGLQLDALNELANLEGMILDTKGYQNEINKNKANLAFGEILPEKNEQIANLTKTLSPTDTSFKYIYEYDKQSELYNVPIVKTKVLAVIPIYMESKYFIITDKSNFYHESGGQTADQGEILSLNENIKFQVEQAYKINNSIVHVGKLDPSSNISNMLQIGDDVQLIVNPICRKLNTIHHTSIHLLNAAIHCLFKKVTYQVSSSVTNENCKLEVALIGQHLKKEEILKIENLVQDVIRSSTPVETSLVTMSEVYEKNNVTTVPGEVYPETGLRLITINNKSLNFLSNELCCGTHVRNTKEIDNFCISNFKQTSSTRFSFTAVAGQLSRTLLQNAAKLNAEVSLLEKRLPETSQHNLLETEIKKIHRSISHNEVLLPYSCKILLMEKINLITKKLSETKRLNTKNAIEWEVNNILHTRPKNFYPFVVHCLSNCYTVETPLLWATKLCSDRPILVVNLTDDIIKARCCVPKYAITNNFSAKHWLEEFGSLFKGEVSPPKGQDPSCVCNMKAKKIHNLTREELRFAINKAYYFAFNNMPY